MTNFEKYKNEILKIARNGELVAVDVNQSVVCCRFITCENCLFRSGTICEAARYEWLYEDDEPYTAEEKQAHTCSKCKHFCFAEVEIGAHFMKKENYGHCLAYDLFPVWPSVVFCPKYEAKEEGE